MLPLTVVVLTKNEERNIAGCLDSIKHVSDDVHVVDSGSDDATLAIAEQWGARIHRNAFESFAQQRNWAIDAVPHKYPWVFHLDADERFCALLVAELSALLARDPVEAGFLVPSKLIFCGRWLKRAGEYPAYQVRLFHRERLRFQDAGHGQRELSSGLIGKLREGYEHHPFNNGVDSWFSKHVQYALREAQDQSEAAASARDQMKSALFGNSVERRRALKALSYRLPARTTLRFLHLVLLKGGCLDGRRGIAYARMKALYEGMISTFLAEQRLAGRQSITDRATGLE